MLRSGFILGVSAPAALLTVLVQPVVRDTADHWSTPVPVMQTVQPPLPYTLRFRLELTGLQPGTSVDADVAGDIRGDASFSLAPAPGGGTDVHLVSALEPGNAFLRTVARWAAPIARYGHDWVLDQAVRQFADHAGGA